MTKDELYDKLIAMLPVENKDDKESKEFYYLGPIQHSGFLKQFVMPGTNATAVEIGYQLSTPVEPNLFSYLTSEIM